MDGAGAWRDLVDGAVGAVQLLASGDPETFVTIRQSIIISGSATALSVAGGMPLGALLATGTFRGRWLFLVAANSGFGLPPVVVGLVLSILLLRHGPLGFLDLR